MVDSRIVVCHLILLNWVGTVKTDRDAGGTDTGNDLGNGVGNKVGKSVGADNRSDSAVGRWSGESLALASLAGRVLLRYNSARDTFLAKVKG